MSSLALARQRTILVTGAHQSHFKQPFLYNRIAISWFGLIIGIGQRPKQMFMLFNYLKIALRNLFKNKLFSFINILGMSISLASVFIIALYVNDEVQYDKHILDGERKFRIYTISTSDNGQVNSLAVTAYPIATYLQKDYPEIESTLRIMDTFGD